MLALVDNVLTRLDPVLDTVEYRVEVVQPNIKGKGRVLLKANGEIVDSGVHFFVMDSTGTVTLDRNTGQFHLKPQSTALVRVVFAGQHEDVEVKR